MSDASSSIGTINGLVRLRAFNPTSVNTEQLLELWSLLQDTNADAALAANVFDFPQTPQCLFFATIHGPVFREFSNRRLPEEYEVVGADEVTHEGDGIDTDTEVRCKFNEIKEIRTLVGLLYITTSSIPSEVVLGLVITPRARHHGLGTIVTKKALEIAFEKFGFHRICATILAPPKASHAERRGELYRDMERELERAKSMLIGMGFSHEGIRRNAIRKSENFIWRDVHHLALLDIEYFDRRLYPRDRRTRWDEMLMRQENEREALLRAESRLRRSGSTDTLRPGANSVNGNGERSGFISSDSWTEEDSSVIETDIETTANSSSYQFATALSDTDIAMQGVRRSFFSFESSDGETDEEVHSSYVRERIERYLDDVRMAPPPELLESDGVNPFADSNQGSRSPSLIAAVEPPATEDPDQDWSEADISSLSADSEGTDTDDDNNDVEMYQTVRSVDGDATLDQLALINGLTSVPTSPPPSLLSADDDDESLLLTRDRNAISQETLEYTDISSSASEEGEYLLANAITDSGSESDVQSVTNAWQVVNPHTVTSSADCI